jgi:outer membrane biogenesis lipoprotein LolB
MGSGSHHPEQEDFVNRLILGTALALLSASALAFHCPADMKKIDAAMAKSPQLSAQQMSEVKKYRADGEALHKAGKHQESVDTLAKAMKLLNIQ